MTSDPDASEDDCSSSPTLTPSETHGLLDLLLSHKSEFLREYLSQYGVPRSGAKADLRSRLQQGLDDGTWQTTDLLRLLEAIEGWGNQHVYLYQAPAALSAAWMDEPTVRAILARHGLEPLLNAPRLVLTPPEMTLASVAWTPHRLRVTWVQGQQCEDRLPERDVHQGPIELRAYRLSTSRRLYAFDWDLLSGNSLLMIPRMPVSRDYQKTRKLLKHQLELLIDLDQFTPVRVSRAIRRIEQSGEARCRQVSYQTARGGRLALTSSTRTQDVSIDPDMERLDALVATQTTGLLGDFFWATTAGSSEREVHTKIYGVDQRVAFLGETTEGELRYVLSRIFYHSKVSS